MDAIQRGTTKTIFVMTAIVVLSTCSVAHGQVDPLEEYQTSSATVLAEVEFLELVPGIPVHIYIQEGVTYAVSQVGFTDANPSSGNWSLPVAAINDVAPIAVESEPWDAVKALFR